MSRLNSGSTPQLANRPLLVLADTALLVRLAHPAASATGTRTLVPEVAHSSTISFSVSGTRLVVPRKSRSALRAEALTISENT